MPAPVPKEHPLRRLFGSLVHRTFAGTLGLSNEHVADYIANLLADFIHVDNIHKIRDARGKPLDEVAEMLMEGDVRLRANSFSREREVHKHIGDFTLFWTGVYPEALRYLRAPDRKDHLLDYISRGKESYYVASTFDYGRYQEEARILRRLSASFELCAFGLNLVRREWERLGDPSSGTARQVLLE
jgi:hypothetical protein